MLCCLLEKMPEKQKNIAFRVNPRNISEVVGHKKSNINFIKQKFFIDNLEIVQDNCVEADTIVLYFGEKCSFLSKKGYYSIYSQ
jgi:hypothetical protein